MIGLVLIVFEIKLFIQIVKQKEVPYFASYILFSWHKFIPFRP